MNKCGLSLMLVGGCTLLLAAVCGQAFAEILPLPGGGSLCCVDLSAPVEAENHLMTSLPEPLNGMVINDFLGADRFYDAGITGGNTVAANVEAGHIWGTAAGHETLTHVNVYVHHAQALGHTDRHATWVGMMIGGRKGGQAQGDHQTGIAPGAALRSGAIATNWNFPPGPYSLSFNFNGNTFLHAYDTYFTDPLKKADVVNSSWGFEDTPGMSVWTIATDGFARQNPRTTFVSSAGNSGPAPNTVSGAASGYNVITVGAMGDANGYNFIAPFSSCGPQDYGQPPIGDPEIVPYVRAPVDIAAPGTSLTSAYYGGLTGGNQGGIDPSGGATNWYSWGLQGTSFAAPIVAGGVALLDSASQANNLVADSRDGRVVKSVLLNSADKTPGWDNGQANVGGVITTTQSLDWALGAGRMNLDQAYDQYLSGTTDLPGLDGGDIEPIGWDYGQLNGVGDANDYVFDVDLLGGKELTATLSWFRNRDVDPDMGLVSDIGFADLDLEIWDANFQNLIATSKSDYNSVEHLHVSLEESGSYALRVKYQEQRFGAVADEYYGLAWSATPVPEPGTLAILLGLLATCLIAYRRRQ